MPTLRLWAKAGLFVLLTLTLSVGGLARAAGPQQPQAPQVDSFVYLPLVSRGYACPTTSANSYAQGPVYQWDNDNPVRPAWNHADKNISLRSYNLNTSETKALFSYVSDPNEGNKPPQLGTMFNPDRATNAAANISNVYRINGWNWQNPPLPGTRGSEVTNPGVTVLGLRTTPGDILQVPVSGYTIGGAPTQMEVIVIYADADTVVLHYTREDSAAKGYTVHVDNICTDPNLLTLYTTLDNATRNTYHGGPDATLDYDLVTLTEQQTFGTAHFDEIRIAIVDTGAYLDPRSCWEFWHWVGPNVGGACQ